MRLAKMCPTGCPSPQTTNIARAAIYQANPDVQTRLLSAPLLKVTNFQWFSGKSISWQKVQVLRSLGNMHLR